MAEQGRRHEESGILDYKEARRIHTTTMGESTVRSQPKRANIVHNTAIFTGARQTVG